MQAKLAINFYERDATIVAPELLGKIFVLQANGFLLKAKIVETEAYLGKLDQASHAHNGLTERNRVMFGPAGRLYVYFTYGMHYCMNVVTGPKGQAQAVLLRAAEPLIGQDIMSKNRGSGEPLSLCSGPAKLAQAFGIGRQDNDQSLLGERLWIEDDGNRPQINTSARVGISKAINAPLRFFIPTNKYVSKPNKTRYNTAYERAN